LSRKLWIVVLIVLSLIAIGYFADNREDSHKSDNSQEKILWVQAAKYGHWKIEGKYDLEPITIKSGEFRIRWIFGADDESKKSMNQTLSRWLKDGLVSEKKPLIRIKLVNHSHISSDPKEVIYYRFYGIELSLSGSNPWEEIFFGSVFKPILIVGNMFGGEAHFRGNGKIGLYVETLPIAYPYMDFGGPWNWELIVEERVQ